MISQESLKGNWNQIVGAVRHEFGQITGDDLSRVRGSVEELMGMIQEKSKPSWGTAVEVASAPGSGLRNRPLKWPGLPTRRCMTVTSGHVSRPSKVTTKRCAPSRSGRWSRWLSP